MIENQFKYFDLKYTIVRLKTDKIDAMSTVNETMSKLLDSFTV